MGCLTRKKDNRLFSLSAKMPSTCFYNNRLKGIRNQNISVSRSMITITKRTGRRTSLWPARPSASSCSPPPWSPSPSSCPPSLRRCSVTTFLNTTYQFNNRVNGFSGVHFSHYLIDWMLRSLQKKRVDFFHNSQTISNLLEEELYVFLKIHPPQSIITLWKAFNKPPPWLLLVDCTVQFATPAHQTRFLSGVFKMSISGNLNLRGGANF